MAMMILKKFGQKMKMNNRWAMQKRAARLDREKWKASATAEKQLIDYELLNKNAYICSKCGYIFNPQKFYNGIAKKFTFFNSIYEGWRIIDGKLICHHCDAHSDDYVYSKTSKEEFDNYWQECVKENNKNEENFLKNNPDFNLVTEPPLKEVYKLYRYRLRYE